MTDDTDVMDTARASSSTEANDPPTRLFSKSNSIVALEQAKPDYRFPEIANLLAYWQSLRKGRLVPKRSDVNPRGIENSLEFAFIAEEVAPGLARFRIAGMHLSDLMGMDVRGMPVSSFFKASSRNRLQDALKSVLAKPQIVKLDLESPSRFGAPKLAARLILLPLADETGAINRILGAFVTVGPIGRGPRTFDITHVETTTLEGQMDLKTLPARTVETTVVQPMPKGKPTRVPYLRILNFES